MYKFILFLFLTYLICSCCDDDCFGHGPPCRGVRKGFISVPDSFYTYYPFMGDSSFTIKNKENYALYYSSISIKKDSSMTNNCDSFFTMETISKTFIPNKTGIEISYSWLIGYSNSLSGISEYVFSIRFGELYFTLDSNSYNSVKYFKEIKFNNITLYDCYQIIRDQNKYNPYNPKFLYYSKSRGILVFKDNDNLWQKI